jgi:uncharacterized protein (TIGR00288 family)
MAPWWSRPTAEGAEQGSEREVEPIEEDEPTEPPPAREAAVPPAREAAVPPAPRRPPLPASEPLPATAPPAAAARPETRPEAPEGGEDLLLPPAVGEGTAAPAPAPTPGDEEGEAAHPARRRRRRNGRGAGSGAERAAEPRAAAPPEPRPRPEPRTEPRREESRREESRATHAARDTEMISLGVPQLQDLIKEIIVSVPERTAASYEERKLALFCDLENVAIGARDSGINFDINLVLERLLEKGKIIVKKAYADWNRYGDYKRPFHEAGIELIDIPQRSYSGKNSADIKMVVDAMDISYAKEHLDTFVLLSGDSDFSPLVSKLKENDKYVIGVGVKGSSSNLLIDSCDEFIYYEDIWRDVERVPKLDALAKKEQEVFGLLIEAILALTRENKDVLWGSMIKQTMQRKRPSFSEGYYGYSAFSDLLEDAERKSIVKLKKDQRSGSYIVTGFAKRR